MKEVHSQNLRERIAGSNPTGFRLTHSPPAPKAGGLPPLTIEIDEIMP